MECVGISSVSPRLPHKISIWPVNGSDDKYTSVSSETPDKNFTISVNGGN